MTSITWAGPRCVQGLAAILGPQNRTQGRCEPYANRKHELKMPAGKLRDVKHVQPRSPAHSHCLRPLKATNNKPLNRVRQLSAS